MAKLAIRWLDLFTTVAAKSAPTPVDRLLLEDAADSNAKKYILLSALSFSKCGGELYVSTPAATVSVGTTPVKANGTTTALRTDYFTHPANNRLQYIGSITKKFEVGASISAKSSVGNVILGTFVALNGSFIAASEILRKIGTANDIGNSGLIYTLDLAENDYIEVFIAIDTGTANITVDRMIVSVKEV